MSRLVYISLIFLCTVIHIPSASTVQSEIDRSRYEEGKKQYELVQRQSEMPHYGQCWRDAMMVIQTGCKRLSDQTQMRLALAYLNCFLELQGRSSYGCDSHDDVKSCVQGMKEGDASSFTTFFTHTQNICYFLQAQVWQESTENTISRLAASSSQVADQLESSHRLQQDMIFSQNQSLKNQEKLMSQAQDLNSVINASSQDVRHLFEDLKKSTQEQRQIIGDLFDQLAKLQSTILGEVSGFYSLFAYVVSMLVCYLLTSTSRTSGARIWLFLIMTVNVVLEQTAVRWASSLITEDTGAGNEQLYWLQRLCRKFFVGLAIIVLCVCVYLYRDINAMNNRLLMEIRKQNSDLCRFITGLPTSKQAVAAASRDTTVDPGGESSDSDYTSDDDDDNSDADSDKTFILPENQKAESDTESFMTIRDDDASEADRAAMLCELYELKKSTPVRELGDTVHSWLANSHHRDPADNDTSIPTQRGSPYNLRPRKANHSPNISPATRVESAKSFSRTIHQMQQITEKNSRLIRAYQQQSSNGLPQNHLSNSTMSHSNM